MVTTDGESSVTVEDFVTIHQLPIANAGADEFVCEGGSIDLQASGGGTYVWSPIESLSDATIAAPTASPQETTTYTVLVTSTQGCQANGRSIVERDRSIAAGLHAAGMRELLPCTPR